MMITIFGLFFLPFRPQEDFKEHLQGTLNKGVLQTFQLVASEMLFPQISMLSPLCTAKYNPFRHTI